MPTVSAHFRFAVFLRVSEVREHPPERRSLRVLQRRRWHSHFTGQFQNIFRVAVKSNVTVSLNCFLSIAIFRTKIFAQGSVATHLRCGGIFKHDFAANLPLRWVCQSEHLLQRRLWVRALPPTLLSLCGFHPPKDGYKLVSSSHACMCNMRITANRCVVEQENTGNAFSDPAGGA